MNDTFLDRIIESTLERVSLLKARSDLSTLRSQAEQRRSRQAGNAFHTALQQSDRVNVIAEIKRASPSKGVINDQVHVPETARLYQAGGACAISVLTEESFFKGSLEDLQAARDAVNLPILRKDFIIDPIQIYEAAAAGADAILLIVAALTSANLKCLQTLARDLGLDALVEVHSIAELEIAATVGANVIGVNNRDLRTFNVSLDVSRELIKHRPEDTVMIAESGISSKEEIKELRSLGFDGFLVGEALMRASATRMTLEALI